MVIKIEKTYEGYVYIINHTNGRTYLSTLAYETIQEVLEALKNRFKGQ